MASEKQAFHGYVREEVHGLFENYQRRIGLTSLSALLTLLILREIESKRLETGAPLLPAPTSPRRTKVSAYVGSEHADAFRLYAEQLGRSASDCLCALVERELEERWLESALKGDRTS